MKDQGKHCPRNIDLMEIESEVQNLAGNLLTALRLAWREAHEAPRNGSAQHEASAIDSIEYLTGKAIADAQELLAQLNTAHDIKREIA